MSLREQLDRPLCRWLGVALTAVLAALVFDTWFMPPRAPIFVRPSIWAVLIDSRWVIGGIRLVGAIGAAYVVLSILARIRQRRWLIKVGSAEVDEDVDHSLIAMKDDQDRLQAELQEANETIKNLRQELQLALSSGASHSDSGATDG